MLLRFKIIKPHDRLNNQNPEMKSIFSIYWLLIASIWYFVNGVLHDIFVIIRHKTGYDRELLRLLMDGHVLMLSGGVLFTCYLMVQDKIQYGFIIGAIVSVFMIGYCLMIFPFLKSFATLFISIMLTIVCVRAYFMFPDIY